MSSKVDINKNGRPVGWHGQSWVYYKGMMRLAFEEQDLLEYVTGNKTLAADPSANERKEFREAQVLIKQIILASLSMELGQRVMTRGTGTQMWKYLEDFYEGKTNAATRTNQEIILYNKLNAMKCKPNWDISQHLDNMFMIKEQLSALNAGVRDPIFTQILIRSLPANVRFDRLRGMVESGDDKVDTSEKLKDQILRMDSFNKCDRELGLHGITGSAQQVGGGQGATRRFGITPSRANIVGRRQSPDKDHQKSTKTDRQQGNCFNCHEQGHRMGDCPVMKRQGADDKKAAWTKHPKKLAETVVKTKNVNNEILRPKDSKQGKQKARAHETSHTKTETKSMQCGERRSTSRDEHDNTVREWCLDNASNVYVASDLRYFIDYEVFPEEKKAERVRGFQKNISTTPIDRGTVQLLVKTGSGNKILTLYDVLYVPDSMNLLSHTQAEDQGITVKYCSQNGAKVYELREKKDKVLEVGRDSSGLFTFTAKNAFLQAVGENDSCREIESSQLQANHTRAEGRADIQRWHERLGNLNRM